MTFWQPRKLAIHNLPCSKPSNYRYEAPILPSIRPAFPRSSPLKLGWPGRWTTSSASGCKGAREDLSDELLLLIFLHLGIADLFRAQYVCNKWHTLILANLEQYLQAYGPWVLMANTEGSEAIVWFPLFGSQAKVSSNDLHLSKFSSIVASYKGLVCNRLYHEVETLLALVVGNPITNEWKQLPIVMARSNDPSSDCKFSSNAFEVEIQVDSDGHYRVLAIPDTGIAAFWDDALEYDSRTDCWDRLFPKEGPQAERWQRFLSLGHTFHTTWYLLLEVMHGCRYWRFLLPPVGGVDPDMPWATSDPLSPVEFYYWAGKVLKNCCASSDMDYVLWVATKRKRQEPKLVMGFVIYKLYLDKLDNAEIANAMVSYKSEEAWEFVTEVDVKHLYGEGWDSQGEMSRDCPDPGFRYYWIGDLVCIIRISKNWLPVAFNLATWEWIKPNVDISENFKGMSVFMPSRILQNVFQSQSLLSNFITILRASGIDEHNIPLSGQEKLRGCKVQKMVSLNIDRGST
ncbi:hypothetical protein SELMODRAFT_411926 [Selaginella moellendorffii]|uniref:F-box domain-containing protein n=1 Tax=Selaginella moellendorffii TaxID=88036 RepID=D8RJG7_SELML|nr:hypothetical protein SELMODRAFT_411926 [Selaginella moellendorffii]